MSVPVRSNANVSSDVQSVAWCCTYYVPDLEDFSSNVIFPAKVAYCVWQVERCPTTSRSHLQMYMEFSSRVSRRQLQNWFPGIHADPRKGTQKQAIDYCKKEDTRQAGPWEYGSPKLGQGTRSDLLQAVDTLKSSGLAAVAEAHPSSFIRYHRGFEAYQRVTSTLERSWMTELHIYYGPSGTGKSHRALREATSRGGGIFYLQRPASGTTVWWDGYESQANIIIDEFYGWMNFTDLLRLCDKYPMQVQVKGGSRPFLGRTLFITSNVGWSTWYRKHFETMPIHINAFERRITNCELLSEVYHEPIMLFNNPELEDLELLCMEDCEKIPQLVPWSPSRGGGGGCNPPLG